MIVFIHSNKNYKYLAVIYSTYYLINIIQFMKTIAELRIFQNGVEIEVQRYLNLTRVILNGLNLYISIIYANSFWKLATNCGINSILMGLKVNTSHSREFHHSLNRNRAMVISQIDISIEVCV